MSTLKVSAIQSPSTTDGGLSISATGAVSGALPVPNRNLLYNGAMQVAQRGTSAASLGTVGGYFTADRWSIEAGSLGTWTQTVEADGPTGSGLTKSLKMLCSTANASPTAGQYMVVRQILEGQDVQRVAKGTASAQQLTLSFWVKSNTTGTYVVSLFDATNTRSVSASYTVDSSATWEQKSVTFPADTTGTFANSNADALRVYFALGAGSDYTSGTLQTSWAAYNAANRFVGQTNLAAAVNNYWQVTGVQLETGPVATEFEHRSYGDELARCQRYYHVLKAYGFVGSGYSTSAGAFPVIPPVDMRAAPSIVFSGSLSGAVDYPTNGTRTPTALGSYGPINSGRFTMNVTGMSSVASGCTLIWIGPDIGISAEL